MMSLPSAVCTSTTDSGVNMCASPFKCDRNNTPASVTLRSPLRLNTWKPPESVRIAPRPVHEAVQPTESLDRLVPRPQV